MTAYDLKAFADEESRQGRRQNAEFLLTLAVEKLQAENAWLEAQLVDLRREQTIDALAALIVRAP